jgi:hypothetical protein
MADGQVVYTAWIHWTKSKNLHSGQVEQNIVKFHNTQNSAL